jgi:hypothetical protein
MKINEK